MKTYVVIKKVRANSVNEALQKESTAEIDEVYIEQQQDNKIGFNLE